MGLEDLEISEQEEAIQTTAFLRSAKILRIILETWGDSSETPSAAAGVKRSNNNNNNNNNIHMLQQTKWQLRGQHCFHQTMILGSDMVSAPVHNDY